MNLITNSGFLNYFFGFDTWLDQPINWIFNINHFFFVILMTLIVLAIYHGVHATTKKGIIKAKVAFIAILFALEVGRMIWVLRGILPNTGENRHPLHTWSFTFCAVNVWVTIGTLTASLFVSQNNRALVIFKNILFGSALVGAGMANFILPEHIADGRSLLHFQNIQTIGIHILLFVIPLWLIKVGELEVRLKNLWMPVLGFVGVTTLSVQASHITGRQFNFEFLLSMGPGPSIPFPFHMPVVFGVIFLITVLLYVSFEFFTKEKTKMPSCNKKLAIIDVANTLTLFILVLFMPKWLGADVTAPSAADRALRSYSITILMIPFVLHIAGLIFTHHLRKKNIERV